MRSSPPIRIDHKLIAQNIRGARKSQGLTQVELAEKAAVSLSCISRAEKAQPVRLATIKKIAWGLGIVLDTLLMRKAADPEGSIIVHRAANATWHALSDSRAHLPEDHVQMYQNPDERRRLGGLGFVHAFMSPPLGIMKDGPGVVPLELYEEVRDAFNGHFYKDSVIYVMRGDATLEIRDQVLELTEGDWVGYRTRELISFRSTGGPGSPGYPALVLWVGANRVTKKERERYGMATP